MSIKTSSSAPPLIRLVHPQAFADFARDQGAPGDRLFRRAGLPVYCDDPTAFVPLQKAWALFDAAAESIDPFVGWHVGRFSGTNRLSAGLLRRIEHAPSLHQALDLLARLVSSEASHLELGIEERHDDIVFFTRYSTLKDWPGYAGSQAYQLEVYVDIIRHYLGRDWVPEEMGIESPTVPAVAEEHFPGTRILPGQSRGYLTIPRTLLHQPSPSLAPESTPDGAILLSGEFDFVDTLKEVVRSYLPDGYPTARKTATLMGFSARTLMRRLAERGLTYQGLIDCVRFQQAMNLLEGSDLPVSEVGRSVGFDDPAHFARMFRRVGGLSPRHFRQTIRSQ